MTAKLVGTPVVVETSGTTPENTGGSLTGSTVNENARGTGAVPSLTVMVIVDVPHWSAAGVSVNVRFVPLPPSTRPAPPTSAVLVEATCSDRDAAGVSTSDTVKGTTRDWSSLMVCAAIADTTGRSLTAFTVSRNEVNVVRTPSFTDTVMVDWPLTFGCGVTVTVRLAPEPPSASAAELLGTSDTLEDDAVTTRLAAAVWPSPTVKASAGVGVSSAIS